MDLSPPPPPPTQNNLPPSGSQPLAPPSSTQLKFHHAFNRESRTIVFAVGEKRIGFKVDAARLAVHSAFLRNMLFDDKGYIGLSGEGTVEFPVIVEGCTEEAFANFLLWLNHFSSSWAPLVADHRQQLLDILHVSHMWEVLPGVKFASDQLHERFDLSPSHTLFLARRYGLTEWVDGAVRQLLQSLLQSYTDDDKNYLGFELFALIATAKESIFTEHQRLGNHPPFPRDFDNGPFCKATQHSVCKRVWAERWFFVIVRRIHSPTDPLPLFNIPNALDSTEHRGMNPDCKDYILTWLRESCDQVRKEEVIICATINRITDLVTV